MNGTPTISDYGLLVLLSAIFGASFLMTKIAVADIPPATIVACRFIIAGLVFAGAMAIAGQRLPSFGPVWIPIFASALLGNALPFFLITWGQQQVDAGLAAIFMAIMPLAALVLSHLFSADEKITRWKLFGVVLGIFGVIVLMGPSKLLALGEENMRQYALLAAALCYGGNAVVTKKLVGLPRFSMVGALMLVSLAMIAPFSIFFDQPMRLHPSVGAMAATLAAGLFPTAIGTLLIFAIIRRQGAGFFGQINFLVPCFGVLWAYLFLTERLPANAWLALFIILAGVAVARIRPRTKLLPANKSELT